MSTAGTGFMRVMVDIQGDIHDMWTISNLIKGQRYNPAKEELEYTLKLNLRSQNPETSEVVYVFDWEHERDEVLDDVKKKMSENSQYMFLGEEDYGGLTPQADEE